VLTDVCQGDGDDDVVQQRNMLACARRTRLQWLNALRIAIYYNKHRTYGLFFVSKWRRRLNTSRRPVVPLANGSVTGSPSCCEISPEKWRQWILSQLLQSIPKGSPTPPPWPTHKGNAIRGFDENPMLNKSFLPKPVIFHFLSIYHMAFR